MTTLHFHNDKALARAGWTPIMVVFSPVSDDVSGELEAMARWPRHVWTSIFTYGLIFIGFPLLCFLAYAWVQQWIL